MGEAYLVRRGGGDSLNFSVVASAAQPASAKENTLWIVSAAVTSWEISAEQPENPAEGLAWIVTGNATDVEFDAIKNGTLIVMPTSCKVYTGGAWVSATIKIYQSGAWEDVKFSPIKDGVLMREMLVRGGRWVSSDDYTSNNPALTQTDGYVQFKGTKTGYGMAYIEDVDLTGKNELVIEGTFTPKDYVRLCVWSELGTYLGSYIAAYAMITETGASIDLTANALTGKYIIGFTSQASYVQQITNFYLR